MLKVNDGTLINADDVVKYMVAIKPESTIKDYEKFMKLALAHRSIQDTVIKFNQIHNRN